MPGGWFENLEWDININSDDNSIDPTGPIAQFGPIFLGCSFRSGRPLDTQTKSVSYFKNAGFVDVVDKLYKAPIGGWAKNKIYKDAGRVNREHWNAGLEGWAMWLLTKYGIPTPWLAEEVQVYVAKVREGINDPKIHGYHYALVLLPSLSLSLFPMPSPTRPLTFSPLLSCSESKPLTLYPCTGDAYGEENL